jgi:hypothetical protein
MPHLPGITLHKREQVNAHTQYGTALSLVCPECRLRGTLEPSGVNDLFFPRIMLSNNAHAIAGFRFCPNPKCRAVLAVFFSTTADILGAFPAVTIDFDATSIPPSIIECLREAITCHAQGCYKACGMMIRKTFEAICDDRGATGKDLRDRIDALQGMIVISKPLMDAMHEIRLLGNDAAHIKSKDYDDVGKEEVESAIELTKEILKALFQYDHLLNRLIAQKKQPPQTGARP